MKTDLIQELRKLISKDQLEKVIESLMTFANEEGDNDLYQDILMQSGKYEQWEDEKRSGTVSKEDLDITRANIRANLLDILREINGEEFSSKQIRDLLSANNPNVSTKTLQWSLMLGAIFTLLIFVTILLIPCPTDVQYSIFRIILSFGVAGLAAVIPGFLQVKYRRYISAGGAMGVFVLVYAFNPALVGSLNNCGAPFDFTVILESDSKHPQFDQKFPAILTMVLNNEVKSQTVATDGTADYKNIPTNFWEQTVSISLAFPGWQFADNQHTKIETVLDQKTIRLIIEPDGSLSQIIGSVRNENDEFLEGVQLRVGELSTLTDKNGRFKLAIPIDQQREEQPLTVFKEGYQIWDETVYPGAKKDIPIILRKR